MYARTKFSRIEFKRDSRFRQIDLLPGEQDSTGGYVTPLVESCAPDAVPTYRKRNSTFHCSSLFPLAPLQGNGRCSCCIMDSWYRADLSEARDSSEIRCGMSVRITSRNFSSRNLTSLGGLGFRNNIQVTKILHDKNDQNL